MSKNFLKFVTFLSFIVFADVASAHTGLHDIDGFMSGFSHPFFGLDHTLVMLGVGLWASRLSPRQAGFTIAGFLSFMLMGAGLALIGFSIPHVESGILASVFITALLLSVSRQLSVLLTGSLIAGFAMLHGFAHGLEIPQAAAPIGYALGFLSATAVLHGLGLALGLLLNKHQFGLRVAGFITGGLGLWLLVSA